MKKKKDNFIKNLHEIISYFGISSLIFLAIGLKDIDNYPDWLSFSIILLATGILFGIILYFILIYFIPKAKIYKNNKNIGFLLILTFLFSLVFFGLGSIINKSSNQKTECKEYIIQSMGESGSRQIAYYIFINNGKKIERLNFGKAFNENHHAGDKISLCIITGKLGFKYYKINHQN